MTPTKRTRLTAVLMAGFYLIFPVLAFAAENTMCRETLSELSWALGGTNQLSELNSDRSGKKWHGAQCTEAEIVDWFKSNSWSHLKTVSLSGAVFGSGERQYRADRGLVFCLPRQVLLRWVTNGCSAQASVMVFDGRITQVTAGPSI